MSFEHAQVRIPYGPFWPAWLLAFGLTMRFRCATGAGNARRVLPPVLPRGTDRSRRLDQRTSICGAHARADKERASRARSRMGSLGLSLAAAAPTGLTESALVAAMILAAAFVALAQQTLP